MVSLNRVFKKEVLNERGETIGHDQLTSAAVLESCINAVMGNVPVNLPGKTFPSSNIYSKQREMCDEIRKMLIDLEEQKIFFVVTADNRGVRIVKL